MSDEREAVILTRGRECAELLGLNSDRIRTFDDAVSVIDALIREFAQGQTSGEELTL